MIIHPSSIVDEAEVPGPPMDGYVVDDDGGTFRSAELDYCDGPGRLVREYRRTEHAIDMEIIEDCPACDGQLVHHVSRVIYVEDQSEAEQWRQPGEAVSRAV